MLKGGAPTAQTTGELFAGKKAVLFGVPGAFTPTCSNEHCPMFINLIPKIKAQGAEVVACVSVNDPFVMDAWGKAQNAESVGLQMIGTVLLSPRCSIRTCSDTAAQPMATAPSQKRLGSCWMRLHSDLGSGASDLR